MKWPNEESKVIKIEKRAETKNFKNKILGSTYTDATALLKQLEVAYKSGGAIPRMFWEDVSKLAKLE